MPAPLPIFRGAHNMDISACMGLAAFSSPGIVYNTDALQVQDYPLDPYQILDGSDTYGANVRPIVVPNKYYYLNLFVAWTATTGDCWLPTAPAVHVFGLLPREQKQDVAYPHQADAAFPDLSGDNTGGNWWVPLLPEGGTSGAPTTMASGKDMSGLLSGEFLNCAISTPFYMAGTRRLMVTIATAGAVDESSSSSEGSGATKAIIAGWMSG